MQLHEIENIILDYVDDRAKNREEVENLISNLQDMLYRVERVSLEEWESIF